MSKLIIWEHDGHGLYLGTIGTQLAGSVFRKKIGTGYRYTRDNLRPYGWKYRGNRTSLSAAKKAVEDGDTAVLASFVGLSTTTRRYSTMDMRTIRRELLVGFAGGSPMSLLSRKDSYMSGSKSTR